jgi:hypothetical protein
MGRARAGGGRPVRFGQSRRCGFGLRERSLSAGPAFTSRQVVGARPLGVGGDLRRVVRARVRWCRRGSLRAGLGGGGLSCGLNGRWSGGVGAGSRCAPHGRGGRPGPRARRSAGAGPAASSRAPLRSPGRSVGECLCATSVGCVDSSRHHRHESTHPAGSGMGVSFRCGMTVMSRHTRAALARTRSDRSGGCTPRGLALTLRPAGRPAGRRGRGLGPDPDRGARRGRNGRWSARFVQFAPRRVGPTRPRRASRTKRSIQRAFHPVCPPRGRPGRASPGEADETVDRARVSSGSLPAGSARPARAGRAGRNGRSSARFIRLAPRGAGLDAPRRASRTKRPVQRAVHPARAPRSRPARPPRNEPDQTAAPARVPSRSPTRPLPSANHAHTRPRKTADRHARHAPTQPH